MTLKRLNLNRDWRFARADVAGAAAADFDDSSWEPIGLPHTFDLPYFRTPEFYVGYGWYRRDFEIAPEWRGKRLFLEFEGAFQVAEVLVNGRRVGEHRGGYTGFSFDITGATNLGHNVLAVRVNNNWDPRLAPRAGEHIFSGGLYRDVHLVVKHPLHVTWHGHSVATPHVTHEISTLGVRAEVHNASSVVKDCHVETRLIDPDPRRVHSSVTDTQYIEPGETFLFDQSNTYRAKLWHPDHPHLYRVRTEVFDHGELVDTVETTVGFRWFEWTADRGFFLNGEHLYLRGANAHQDHAGWGIAITRAACERDVRLLKEAGFNFVRGAHYPHHPAFADACDRVGLLFWSENCFWGKGGFGPEGYWNASAYPVKESDFVPFEESCKQALREMIRINRNHPSIVAWSMCNEPFFTYNLDRCRSLLRDLVKLSRELDPTRPAAIGGAQRGDIDHLGDVAGYNGDGARLCIYPGVPNMVSEYGAISKPHDAYDPFFGELQAEEFPWRSGQAIWCGFDYGTIAGKQGLKGIVDHFRLPKRSWHWYRNAYRGITPPSQPAAAAPAKLHLSADKTTIRGTDATDDCQIVVTVLDADDRHVNNCPPVTLTIESGPGEFPTGPSITFDPATDIQIVQGRAAIAFRSYHGGTSVIRATSPGLADAMIEITTEGEPVFVPGVTPPARSRPYVPPPPSQASLDALRNAVNVALDRPCRASSEVEGRPARFANDGDTHTSWAAPDGDERAWWQVDLEGFYQLAGCRITFEREGNYRFTIDTSTDGDTWALAIDRTPSADARRTRNDIFPPGLVARHVRVTFTQLPAGARAGLSELDVQGILSVR